MQIRSYRDLSDLVDSLTAQVALLRHEGQLLFARERATHRQLERERELVAEYRTRALKAEAAASPADYRGLRGADGALLTNEDIARITGV